jgi:hypothetical protein
MTRTLDTAIAYWDDQDPTNTGWAYRLTYSDGHQESGGLDTVAGDDPAVLAELEALVVRDGGTWTRPDYRDGDGGSYEWRAE